MNHIQLTPINHGKIKTTSLRNLIKYKFKIKRFCDHNSNKQMHTNNNKHSTLESPPFLGGHQNQRYITFPFKLIKSNTN